MGAGRDISGRAGVVEGEEEEEREEEEEEERKLRLIKLGGERRQGHFVKDRSVLGAEFAGRRPDTQWTGEKNDF